MLNQGNLQLYKLKDLDLAALITIVTGTNKTGKTKSIMRVLSLAKTAGENALTTINLDQLRDNNMEGCGLLVLRNPEVYLTPATQTSLGHVLGMCVANGIQVVVETYSEFLLDGVRMAVKDNLIRARHPYSSLRLLVKVIKFMAN